MDFQAGEEMDWMDNTSQETLITTPESTLNTCTGESPIQTPWLCVDLNTICSLSHFAESTLTSRLQECLNTAFRTTSTTLENKMSAAYQWLWLGLMDAAMKTDSSPTLISWRTSIQSILTQHPSGDYHQWFSTYLLFFHPVNKKNPLDHSYNVGNFLNKVIYWHALSIINHSKFWLFFTI